MFFIFVFKMLVLIAIHRDRENKTFLAFKKTNLILKKLGNIKRIWSMLGGQTEDFWDRDRRGENRRHSKICLFIESLTNKT